MATKCYKKSKGRLRKVRHVKDIKIFLETEKTKSEKRHVKRVKISLNKKKKKSVNIIVNDIKQRLVDNRRNYYLI